MRLAKKHGGATVGPHEWVTDGDVVDVPDTLAADLIASAPDEWSEAGEAPVKRRTRTVSE